MAGGASAILLIVWLSFVANVIQATGYLYPTSSLTTSNGTAYQVPTNSFQTPITSENPCGTLPGVSAVSFDGGQICVAGPPLIVGPDGIADFRNGTKVSLGFSGWYPSLIMGTPYDTVVLENGTRILFDSAGVEALIYPNLGEESFSNGTLLKFPACSIPIDADPTNYPMGVSGNGTVWYTENGTTVYLYPNGTCGTSTGSPP